jgi:hypothetical protein
MSMTTQEKYDVYLNLKKMAEETSIVDKKDQLSKAAENMLRSYNESRENDLVKRELKFQKKIESRGGTYSDWLAWAASLYPITKDAQNQFTVKSHAKDWKTNKHKHVYTFDSKIEALEKIDRLIATKENDRARGAASGKDDFKAPIITE